LTTIRKLQKPIFLITVKNTTIRQHIQREVGQFTMGGRHYTFVRLKMPKETFDQLVAEAKAKNG